MTVEELRVKAKEMGLTGYSNLKKKELVSFIAENIRPVKGEIVEGETEKVLREELALLTVLTLREKAKNMGLTGYSKMRKEELIDLISKYQKMVSEEPSEIGELLPTPLISLPSELPKTECLVVSVKKEKLIKAGYASFEAWEKKPENVYIGRAMGWVGAKGSKWKNPYPLKQYPLEMSLKMYKEHVITSGLVKDLPELKGKTLGCWCKPEGCHGDVLVEMLRNHNHYLKVYEEYKKTGTLKM